MAHPEKSALKSPTYIDVVASNPAKTTQLTKGLGLLPSYCSDSLPQDPARNSEPASRNIRFAN
jgi:hypothetical protein